MAKHNIQKRKAFTLIELLIVIAIIGILFIVLVSKVDFATDKAKMTGVQTTFRSFQAAFDTVARENSGFNTFGWDLGDKSDDALWSGKTTPNGTAYTYTNASKDVGDRIRNSYDIGDANLNGQYDDGEVWTGRKIYTETWYGTYTLVKPGTSSYDADAIFDLETAINKNLDPQLHIVIADDGTISMANGYQDPWSNQYHGQYITNAHVDSQDNGAIIMYSNGPNGIYGSEHFIAGGIVYINVPNNNVKGQDDMSMISCYSYTNGFGEVIICAEKLFVSNDSQLPTVANSVAMIDEQGYSNLMLAINAASDGDTIMLVKDTSVNNIVIPSNTTLDLNGYTLTANNIVSENEYAFLIDGSTDLTGFLKIGRDNATLAYYNPSVPIYVNDGYKFAKVKMQITNGSIIEENGTLKWTFKFRPLLGCDSSYQIFRSEFYDGIADNNLTLRVYVKYTQINGSSAWTYFNVSDSLIANVYSTSAAIGEKFLIEDQYVSYECIVAFCSGTGAVYQYTDPTLDWYRNE